MILGMSTHAYTLLHVIISLLGIGSGMVVAFGLLAAKRLNGLTAFFLITTVLTSVTGFGFPNAHITPGIKIGILSMIVLAIAIFARYIRQLAGAWRRIYVVTAMMALYFNVFVLVVQSFEKVPALQALVSKYSHTPFAITQLLVLVLFMVLGIFAVKRFRVEPPPSVRVAGASAGR